MTPIISVIVTSYNHEAYISKCLDSVISQKDCPCYEIIVGDDCSKDGTKKIIEEYAEQYPEIIRVLNRDCNLGLQQNMKNCFEHCTGEYIAICEGDDYWLDPHKLKIQYEALSSDLQADLCFNDILLQFDDRFEEHIPKVKEKFTSSVSAVELIQTRNAIGNFSCCMYKKRALNSIHESFWKNSCVADFSFNLMVIAKSHHAVYINKKLSVYRILNSSLSHKSEPIDNFTNMVAMLSYTQLMTGFSFSRLIDEWIDSLKKQIITNIVSHEGSCARTEIKVIGYKRVFGVSFLFRKHRIMIGIGKK